MKRIWYVMDRFLVLVQILLNLQSFYYLSAVQTSTHIICYFFVNSQNSMISNMFEYTQKEEERKGENITAERKKLYI